MTRMNKTDITATKRSGIHIPSLQIESKTGALTPYLWAVVILVSMFTAIVPMTIYAFSESYFQLVEGNIENRLIILVSAIVVLSITAIILGIKLASSLVTSYKFENGVLTRGKLMKTVELSKDKKVLSGGAILYSLGHIGDGSKAFYGTTASNAVNLLQRIFDNLDRSFVEKYFDTDAYRKKEYGNVRFVRETKYSAVYETENGKQIKIPRMYEGLCTCSENVKGVSIAARIAKRCVLVFAAMMVFTITALGIRIAGDRKKWETVDTSKEVVSEIPERFGYEKETQWNAKAKEQTVTYEKTVGTKTSRIHIRFSPDGSCTVTPELFYEKKPQDIDEELRAFMEIGGHEIEESEWERFLGNLHKTMEGEYSYDKLYDKNGKRLLTIGTSDGYIDLH